MWCEHALDSISSWARVVQVVVVVELDFNVVVVCFMCRCSPLMPQTLEQYVQAGSS